MMKTAWVILAYDVQNQYWNGGNWTPDINAAQRFGRKQDAQIAIAAAKLQGRPMECDG